MKIAHGHCPYPPDKTISPFDPVDADNYFAVTSGYTSYLGSYEEIGNIASPFDPRNSSLKGSYSLGILKRHSLVKDGEPLYCNPFFDDGHQLGTVRSMQFMIYTNRLHRYSVDTWDQPLELYSIQDDSGAHNCALWFKTFETAELAVQHAIQLSTHRDMVCVIAQCFSTVDRR